MTQTEKRKPHGIDVCSVDMIHCCSVSIFKAERKSFHRPAGDVRGRILKIHRPLANDRHNVMGKTIACAENMIRESGN
jgi:hypothetical protein